MAKPWKDRIEEARARGVFSVEDIQDAGQFNSCAAGEIHGPCFFGEYFPHVDDAVLDELSMMFWRAVDTQRIEEAELLRLQIVEWSKQ